MLDSLSSQCYQNDIVHSGETQLYKQRQGCVVLLLHVPPNDLRSGLSEPARNLVD